MPSDADYQRLLDFRTRLRRFDQWSRAAAEEHGLTHAQHQLLLAVRGQEDHRVVRLRLTEQGRRVLTELTSAHLEELRRLAPLLGDV